ncbi:MAG: DUF4115 domain-containing protein [Gammaproteobacteria bacterium]|nr:DUF4115 domain-containing protein [Gammaproteobacteria bacterium]
MTAKKGVVKPDIMLETESLFGPGERLRVARETQGLSQEDVAKELRLSVSVINALEDNNQDQLPAKAFVDGYLKGYARILNLDAVQLIADYHCPEAPLPVAKWVREDMTQSAPLVFRRGIKSSLRRFFLWLLLVAGLLAVYLLFLSNGRFMDILFSETNSVGTQQVPLLLSGQDDMPEQKNVTDEVVDAPVLLPADESRIVLSSSGESWVDIRDMNGMRLVFGLLREGDHREVSGKAPFQVLLGNSLVIDIVYNGEQFDQTPFNSGRTARFTLGAGTSEISKR